MSNAVLTADLNVLQATAVEIQYLNGDLNIIAKLDDEPNDVGGLSSDQLKAKFDEAGNVIKDYINNTLIPAILASDSTEAAREAAEKKRVANEKSRQSAETERASAETERASAETERASAETARQTAEAQRQTAEAGRVAAEKKRVTAEAQRQENEGAREMAETARVSAEEQRQENEEARQAAAIHTPRVGGNGNWEVWDYAEGKYVSTGYPAIGSPAAFDVDENGNLRLYYTGDTAPDYSIDEEGHLILQLDEDTSVDLGLVRGADGKDGTNGTNGKDGITPTIGDNGNWYLGDEDTGKPSRGATGPQGPQGDTGPQGPQGDPGGTPEYAESLTALEESGDTSKLYLLPDGYVYAYAESETEETVTVTDQIDGAEDNPYYDNARLSGSGGDTVERDVTGYLVTPLIDLTPYSGKHIILHLDGVPYFGTSALPYTQTRLLGANKDIIVQRDSSIVGDAGAGHVWASVSGAAISRESDSSAKVEMDVPPKFGSAETPIWYMRFGAAGTSTQSSIYVTYEITQTITKWRWTNTGVKYGSGTDAELAGKVSALNNEGVDTETVALLPSVVKAFYDSAAYPDNDYTTTHLTKITYPCRADIPVPYAIKWEYNEAAMRTIIAVDTNPIGTANYYTLRTYDVTGLKKFPIYNLIPGTAYYYKVTHVMADGSLIDAKSGSFTASSNAPWRLLYIDGTQNVRDLGGWTGLNGKRVKYGKIIRGAALSDSSASDLIVTGKGRLALADLKIQAELNLGAADTETSIAASCAYKKIGYSNYADAITAASARAQFKEALEWIVACLDGSLSQSGLPQVKRNIYMHCQGGCDRTGTLSFLLLGLLGVSESDLAKEYELSSFSVVGMGRLRNTVKAVDVYDYSGMVAALKTYSGDTLAAKFESFATACGVSADTISSFRTLMLEEANT